VKKIASKHVAHVLNDETQRKYIQAVKRLVSRAQKLYPNEPSRCVDYGQRNDNVTIIPSGHHEKKLTVHNFIFLLSVFFSFVYYKCALMCNIVINVHLYKLTGNFSLAV